MSFPRPGALFQVTLDTQTNGVMWSSDSRTLVTGDIKGRVIATPVSFEGGFHQGESTVLFTLAPNFGLPRQTSDLKRFLVAEGEQQSNPTPLRVLTAWPQRVARH
jgi:hypothetical protein